MKPFLELKRQDLPHYKADSLWRTVRRSAKEHGYRSVIWYGIIRFKDNVFGSWAQTLPWNGMRIRLQRWRGVSIGNNVHWGSGVSVDAPFPYFLIVEDGAALAGNNVVLTHIKPSDYFARCIDSFAAPVIVRKNAWVAVGVTLMPGVEIGEGAMVSAGSIVNTDIPPMVLAGGNPAKVIMDLSRFLKANYSPEEYHRILEERATKFKQFRKVEESSQPQK